ncbi:MAG: hypothetical protein ACLUAR_03465 [Pilosibacter sp.]
MTKVLQSRTLMMMPVQKGKEVILLKKLIRKYGHVWMLSYAFIYIPGLQDFRRT